MQRLIKNRQIVEDTFLVLPETSCESLPEYAGKDLLLPLKSWLACQDGCQDALAAHQGRVGVWLDSNELPAQLGETLAKLDIIALRFPVFKDGRPFSSARELRLNFGYEGEIRAIGDVLRDQLFYMSRCGFDAFLMREDQDMQEALNAFDDFHEGYQSSVDRPVPLFRRRHQPA